MRKKVVISKTSQNKITDFINKTNVTNKDQLLNDFIDLITYELKVQKNCSEKNIVDYYIKTLRKNLPIENVDYNLNDNLTSIKQAARTELVSIYTKKNKNIENSVDIYFNEVKKEYILHPVQEQDEVEFSEENRDIFLKNNLKLVVECAKRYSGLGVPFEDLIQAGNIGLCTAFEKYDKNRANLRIAIINDIKKLEEKFISFEEASEIVQRNFVYAKNLETTLTTLPKTGFKNKEDFISWANKNIKTAVFASVAFQWIRANILIEINKYSKVLHVPKQTKNDDEEFEQGDNNSTTIIRLDSINTHTNDVYHDNQTSEITHENFIVENEELENNDKKAILEKVVGGLLHNLSALETRIIKKTFGIGCPYQLNSLEIAENEGLTSNKVKYILKIALQKIQDNLNESQRKQLMEILYG